MATKIYSTDLKVGMFVADLDRPWVDTPFLLQGFVIEDEEQIAALRAHCEYVMVDRARSVGAEYEAPVTASSAATHTPGGSRRAAATPAEVKRTPTVATVRPPEQVTARRGPGA